MKTNVYPSEKGKLITLIYAITCVLLLGIMLVEIEAILTKPFTLIALLLPLTFLTWIWMDTYYKIENNYLYYRSGPFRGKIDIGSIREITKNKTLWVGYKPVLGQKGLIIRYKEWDEIYISPTCKEAFLTELLEKNEAIRIKE